MSGPPPHPSTPRWSRVTVTLARLVEEDERTSSRSPVRLAGFAGEAALALVTLRATDGEPLRPALLEVLALLLPLGADRLAVALPPDPAGAAGGRRPACVVVRADGRRRPCVPVTELVAPPGRATPLARGCAHPPAGTATVADALARLLDRRDRLVPRTGAELVAQLGRVLLLGHGIALAPDTGASLESIARGDGARPYPDGATRTSEESRWPSSWS